MSRKWREMISILQAAKETPEDDTPRLILADWLEEYGCDARAEFIRVQCTLARIGPRSEQSADLKERKRALLHSNRRQWQRPLSKLGPVTFHRGLLRLASYPYATRRKGVRAEQWPDERWAWVEWVRTGVLIDRYNPSISADDWWFLRRVTGLDLSGSDLLPVNLETMVRLPQLANLLDLNLSGTQVNDRVAQALVESPHLARLLRLHVPDRMLGVQGKELLQQRFGTRVCFGST